jgi:hypothetical protein
MSAYTDDQIVTGIEKALGKQDVNAIPGLIALLALQNPERAESIRQTILLGLSIAAKAGQERGNALIESPDTEEK